MNHAANGGHGFSAPNVRIKLTRTAHRAYKSAPGLIQENEQFLADTERLQKLVGLINQPNPEDARPASIDEHLLQTAKACDEYASQLVTLLGFLRWRPGELRALEAIRTMMLRRQRNTEIQTLEEKLINVQKDLLLALTTSSHSRQSSAMVVIHELKHQNAVLEANTTTKLESVGSLIRGIDQKKEGTSKATKVFISHLDNLVIEAQRVKKHHEFLKSLRFREIKQRYSAIQDHHKATFNWVFVEVKTGFREWLEEGSGFFWVKVKAGSGKSTLMKFIATHDDTQSLLRTWGGESRVITASHFFLNAGLSMQKSLTGLFQTILYQSFFRAFEQLSSQESLPLRFCFFVDGLDEYTVGAHRYTGTFEELLSPLRVLASSPSIKICVSSRPWDAFDREFSQVKRKLQLEDLTREDIRRYVKEELGVDPKFQRLSEMDLRCSEIKDTIVQRAQGVFPWVYLVVNSHKRGLIEDDNYANLQSRLNELPDDLQRYFEHMLQTIETIYWDSTTRIFRVVIAAEQALPLLAFELLDREMDDSDYALTMQSSTLTDIESEAICKRSNTRLNALRGDLLYVTVNPTETGLFKSQVDFLHRTVRGFFLDTCVIDDMIQKRPTETFNPHLSLCRIMLALNKVLTPDKNSSQVYNQLYIVADGLMHYARHIEDTFKRLEGDGESDLHKANLEQVFKILDELDRTNCEGLNRPGGHNKTFLAATIQARLTLYTTDHLQKTLLKFIKKNKALCYLLLNFSWTYALIQTRIYIYEDRTPWELFLEICYQHARQDGNSSEYLTDDIGSAVELMVQRGARVHGTFRVSSRQFLGLADILDGIRLPQHCRSRVDEAVESRGPERTFLSRMFGWN
ncbi:hypothetical protein EDB82DRAFT_564717 [Fusarium venenatum]|uniref:uncharacterized protein n=1 Tax=Fusarium venenatum TaxID=56646 RepID=UPI001DB0E661|nr:hypothetical protein EDB82DRAFT_564717 [Fusarium venenatum]